MEPGAERDRDLAGRIAELERQVALLESTGALAIGTALLGTALSFLRRSRARFGEISAERIRLVRPVPAGKLWFKRDVTLGELGVVGGSGSSGTTGLGSELKLWRGRVMLYNGEGNGAVQLDATFQPPPPQVAGRPATGDGEATGAGPGYAWVLDRHGLAAELSPLRDAPALMLYGHDERPSVSVSGARGVASYNGAGQDPLSGQRTSSGSVTDGSSGLVAGGAGPEDAAAAAGVPVAEAQAAAPTKPTARPAPRINAYPDVAAEGKSAK